MRPQRRKSAVVGVTAVAIFWPRVGGGLHIVLALPAVWFFQAFSNAATFVLIIPLIRTAASSANIDCHVGRPGSTGDIVGMHRPVSQNGRSFSERPFVFASY